MSQKRTYRTFTHKEAVLRICCENFDAVTAEIVRQRGILEDYIKRHADFRRSLEPLELLPGAPEVAERMARAARLVGVGPRVALAILSGLAMLLSWVAAANEDVGIVIVSIGIIGTLLLLVILGGWLLIQPERGEARPAAA